ncbi:MAG: hypothetical protein ABR912_04145 [Terracidiphilus sp.]|jgi:hypothetical protein
MNESNAPVPSVPAAVPYLPTAAAPALPRPKTIGDVLERTYRLTRGHFKLLVGIAAIPSGIVLLLALSMEAAIWIPLIRQWPNSPSPGAMLHHPPPAIVIPVFVGFALLSLAIFSIYLAAASYASVQADSGVGVTLREAYELAWRRGGRYLWLLVLCYLYACLPLLAIEAAVLLGANAFAHSGSASTPALFFLLPLALLLYIGAIVYAILIGLRLSLAFPACVTEGLTASAAIKRSFQLTRGAKGRIFLVLLVIYAALYAGIFVAEIAVGVVVAVGVGVAAAAGLHPAAPWSYIGLGLLGFCAFGAMTLFISLNYAAVTAALAVLYHDQRLRKDGPGSATLQTGEAV